MPDQGACRLTLVLAPQQARPLPNEGNPNKGNPHARQHAPSAESPAARNDPLPARRTKTGGGHLGLRRLRRIIASASADTHTCALQRPGGVLRARRVARRWPDSRSRAFLATGTGARQLARPHIPASRSPREDLRGGRPLGGPRSHGRRRSRDPGGTRSAAICVSGISAAESRACMSCRSRADGDAREGEGVLEEPTEPPPLLLRAARAARWHRCRSIIFQKRWGRPHDARWHRRGMDGVNCLESLFYVLAPWQGRSCSKARPCACSVESTAI
jgi:hypothetical protein